MREICVRMGRLNPDVIKLMDSMSKNNGLKVDARNGSSDNLDANKRIMLSDNEFGKY